MKDEDNVIDLDAKREQKRRDKQSDDQNEWEDTLAAAHEWLDKNPTFNALLRQGVYFMQTHDRDWIFFPQKNLSITDFEWTNNTFRKAATKALQDKCRTYNDVTYTFGQTPPDILNLLDRSHWLSPTFDEGECHWLFDVMVQSLGNNKPENMAHLEHVIAHKWMCPWEYTLPCLVIYGEGGVGKNMLVDGVCHTIFDRQTISCEEKDLTGNFNTLAKGKAVMMLNEAETDKTNDAILRLVFHSARITINEKFVKPYQVDNTPLYVLGSNDDDGGVFLNRSQADRRYSVLHCKKGQSLNYWIARHEGWIPQEQQYITLGEPAYARAEVWMDAVGKAIANNPDEVVKWLSKIVKKYFDQPKPQALHGEDFKRLLDMQQPIDEQVFEAVFNDPQFTHISRTALHKGYKAVAKEGGYKQAYRAKKFYEHVREWLSCNHPEYLQDLEVWQGGTHPRCYVNPNQPERMRHTPNDDTYIKKEGYEVVWCGPEVG